jgi:glycerol-3-phosphate acyltransferase PlsY
MEIAGLYIYAYLMGSAPAAYLIGRIARGIDLREYGSGNLGASNVARQVGRVWLVPLSLFDVLVKGVSPVLIRHYILGLDRGSPGLLLAAALAVVGHNWSLFTRFNGGRGIAVVAGVLLALSPLLAGAFLLVYVVGWLFTRSSGIWVLVALTGLPVWALLLGQPASLSWFGGLLLMLVLLKRIISNGGPIPPGSSRKQVLLNRLLKDRDVDDRAEWIDRVPAATN